MDSETRIDVRSLSNGAVTVAVMVAGELDMGNAPEFESKLLAAVEGGAGSVLVDLSECEFIDSSTLKVLVRAHSAAEGRISLLVPHANVRKVLVRAFMSEVSIDPDIAVEIFVLVRDTENPAPEGVG